MTFYDSFARLGKNLDHLAASSNLAWTWRHYTGLHYQSFSERTAASEAFCPMAWVWSSYRATLPITVTDIAHEIESRDIDHEIESGADNITIPHLSPVEELQKNAPADPGVDYFAIEPYRLHVPAPIYDDEAVRFIDIIKLVGSFIFAGLVIYGVHDLRG